MPGFYEIFAIIHTQVLQESEKMQSLLQYFPSSMPTYPDWFEHHEFSLKPAERDSINKFITDYTDEEVTTAMAAQIAQQKICTNTGKQTMEKILQDHNTTMDKLSEAWTHVVKVTKFHDIFDDFLHDNNLDVASFMDAHRMSQKLAPSKLSKKSKKKEKETYPSPGQVLQSDKKRLLHEWVWGSYDKAWGTSLDPNDPNEVCFSVVYSIWSTSWKCCLSAYKRLETNSDVDITKIREIWSTFEDQEALKTKADCRKYLKLLQKAVQDAKFLRDKGREAIVVEYVQAIKQALEANSPDELIRHGIAGISRARLHQVANLLSEKEVEEIKIAWKRFLDSPTDFSDDLGDDEAVELDASQVLGSTISMEEIATLSKQELLTRLGATDRNGALPLMVNAVPTAGWASIAADKPKMQRLLQKEAGAAIAAGKTFNGWQALSLRWDQLAGVYKQVSTWAQPASEEPGFLNADDVGLGKSAQLVASICMYAHWFELKEQGKALPPIHQLARGKDYLLYGHQEMESRPHLIVCPNGLVGHWINQLAMWGGPYLEVHIYKGSSTSHYKYFGDCVHSSKWSESKVPFHRRVVIATYSAIQSDARAWLGERSEDDDKFDAPRLQNEDVKSVMSVLTMKFATTSLDEGQELRTGGPKFDAALTIRDNSLIVSLYSATPVIKGIPDLYNLGYFLRIPSLLTRKSIQDEQKSFSNSKAVRRAEGRLRKQIADSEPEEDLISDLVNATHKTFQDIIKIRQSFDGYLIRRSRKLLLNMVQNSDALPPYFEHVLLVHLSEQEKAIYHELFGKDTGTFLTPKLDALSASKSFHTRPRQAALNAPLARALAHCYARPGCYRTCHDFWERGSTKEKTAIQIVLHHILPLTTQPLWIDGNLIKTGPREGSQESVAINSEELLHNGLPFLEQTQQVRSSQGSRAFVIYSEFVGALDYLKDGLRLYKLNVEHLHGGLALKLREEMITNFNSGRTDVLLLSSVGKVGINLHRASVMIIMDPQFSHEDTYQIIGRVWREPNRKQVHVYRLLAEDTADTQVENIANHKQKLAFAFREGQPLDSSDALKSYFGEEIVGNATLEEAEDEPQEHDQTTGKRKRSRKEKEPARKRQKRSKSVLSNTEIDEPAAEDETGPLTPVVEHSSIEPTSHLNDPTTSSHLVEHTDNRGMDVEHNAQEQSELFPKHGADSGTPDSDQSDIYQGNKPIAVTPLQSSSAHTRTRREVSHQMEFIDNEAEESQGEEEEDTEAGLYEQWDEAGGHIDEPVSTAGSISSKSSSSARDSASSTSDDIREEDISEDGPTSTLSPDEALNLSQKISSNQHLAIRATRKATKEGKVAETDEAWSSFSPESMKQMVKRAKNHLLQEKSKGRIGTKSMKAMAPTEHPLEFGDAASQVVSTTKTVAQAIDHSFTSGPQPRPRGGKVLRARKGSVTPPIEQAAPPTNVRTRASPRKRLGKSGRRGPASMQLD
ncbi:hypothetical protein FRC16_010207 [Serendipita sp. 398]|nr:hypothetical protein FRC16_010207 [Serendipita sp. 398]